MKLTIQKRLAAHVMKVGTTRVWIDPNFQDEVSLAITKNDVRRLVEEGAIQPHQKIGVSRGRARFRMEQKRKGRRSGQGSRKGKQHALLTGKDRWMMKIRPMRHELQKLRAEGKITSRVYRELYLRAKGNSFRNTAHLRAHIADHKLEVSR